MMNNTYRKLELENRIFAVVLISTALYVTLNMIFEVRMQQTFSYLFFIYVFLLLVCLFHLYLLFWRKVQALQINIFVMLILGAYIIFLPRSAGPTGGMGYAFQNITVLLLLMTRGSVQVFLTMALTGTALVLFTNVLSFKAEINYAQLVIDYVINLIFLGIFMVFFKRNFDSERDKLDARNQDLEELNRQLSDQSYMLEKTNMEVQSMRDSLQEIILERTRELEEENKKLIEYAFINAHLIRAPLTNIMGAVQLKSDDPNLREIEKGIQEMDEVLKKIAKVLK